MKIIHNCSVLDLTGICNVSVVAREWNTSVEAYSGAVSGAILVKAGSNEHTEEQRQALAHEIAKHLGSDSVFGINEELKLRKLGDENKGGKSELLDELIDKFKALSNTPGNEAIRCSRMHFDGWADDLESIREGMTT